MSRIYFEAPHRQAQVYGSERAWLGALSRRITWGLAEPYVAESLTSVDLIDLAVGFRSHDEIAAETDPFRKRMLAKQRFETWFQVGGYMLRGEEEGLRVGERVVPTSELSLNTAMAVGNDAIKLAAKIHGTCEDFAWIAAEDCDWFGQIVARARMEGIFRINAGWEDVVMLAEEVSESGNGPIVMHYSVSDSFPSAYAAEGVWEPPVCRACIDSNDPECPDCYGDPTLHDAWYDLTPEEQWDLSVQGITKRTYNRQVSPETLGMPFLYGETLFDVISKPVHEIAPTE